MASKLLKGTVQALMPKIELPKYFKVTATPLPGGALRIDAVLHAKGEKAYSAQLPTAHPTLLDVVRAFPSVNIDNFKPMVRNALGLIALPNNWDLECGPSQLQKEGFRLSLDIHQASGTRHWEREIQVTSMQLAELLDVVDWVREANKVDRHNPK